ncbi:MAG: FCD domain-containing protein, partial [Rhodoferax sp.]|nr:FCD domain-containing protein [Rhodoferax sp.]
AFGALGRIKSSYEQHEKIIDALQKRDVAAAFTSMTSHMRPGRDAKTLNDFIISLPRELLAG